MCVRERVCVCLFLRKNEREQRREIESGQSACSFTRAQFKWIGRGSPTPHSFGYAHTQHEVLTAALETRVTLWAEHPTLHFRLLLCSARIIQAHQHTSPLIYLSRRPCNTAGHTVSKLTRTNTHALPHHVLKLRAVTLCHGWQRLVPTAEKPKMSSCCTATGWAGLPVAMAGLLLCCVSTQPPTVCLLDRAHYSRQALTALPPQSYQHCCHEEPWEDFK